MYCKKCGCPISEDAVFCKKCGEKQHQGIESVAVHSHQGKEFFKFSVVFRRVFRTTASKIIAGVLAAAILVTGIVAIVDNQNKNRFVSDSISVVVKPTLKYDNVSSFSEGLAVVEKDKKYGYVDQNGKEVVPPIYYSAGNFSGGVAVAYSKDDCTWHIIDKTGDVKAQLKGYDNVGYSFSDGFIQVEKDDKYGLADTAGKEVIPPIYDRIYGFNEGLARVEKDDKYGFVDKSGNEVIPSKYTKAWDFNDGFAWVEENYICSYIDKAGREFSPLINYSVSYFNDGVALLYFKPANIWYISNKVGYINAPLKYYDSVHNVNDGFVQVLKDGKWGFVDQSGKEVVSPTYDSTEDFNDGFARVEKDGKYGFVDKTGKEVVPLIYDSVENFSEGLAQVQEDGKYGFVDKTGKEVVPFIYDSVENFSEGLARVEKDGKYNYIDKTGKEVVPSEYDLGWGEFSEGFADVRKGKKYGYIDKNGNEAVPMIYDETQEFSEGLAWVRKGKKWGIIKINKLASNDSSNTATSDVPTTSNSSIINATTINIDDYVGTWHIDGDIVTMPNYVSYGRTLSITNLGGDQLSFELFYFKLDAFSCETTLNGNTADFTFSGEFSSESVEIKGTLTFNENSITVNIKSSNFEYVPVESMTFDGRDVYDDGICPRCGRKIIYGNSCDCTWCDICNAWMGGHGHGEGEEPVDGQVASQNPNHSNDPNNGGYLRVVPNLNRMTLEDAKQQITDYNLVYGGYTEEENSAPKGTVLRQYPQAGTEVDSGTTVTLVVSSGK